MTPRDDVAQLIRALQPLDALEAIQIAATLAWIASGAPLYRLAADDPPQHLVSYFTLVDRVQQKLLLVDHKKANLWLPSGGHVEVDEHPQITVRREVVEELGVEAHFLAPIPLLLTMRQTVGSVAPHTDVSLWYALQGNATQPIWFDAAEFYGVRWFAFDELPLERSDPNLPRFVEKLKQEFG